MIKFCASCEVVTTVWPKNGFCGMLLASVGGLVSARPFDVHSSCIFKDLETDYPACVFILKGKKAGCVHARSCVHIAFRLLNQLHAVRTLYC